jgi:hypothetical protein
MERPIITIMVALAGPRPKTALAADLSFHPKLLLLNPFRLRRRLAAVVLQRTVLLPA